MAYSEAARTATRRIQRILVAGILVVTAAIPAALAYQVPVFSPSSAVPPASSSAPFSSSAMAAPPIPARRGEHRGGLGEADGALPAGTTVFDDALPGVANLDRALLEALRRAAAHAADDGVELVVNSGWRSAAYQEQLLRDAVSKYGSEKKAARWVGTPKTSAHVSGDAVDIGPSGAAAWLSERGGGYGLCQVYRNEPWHFELRPEAADTGCPPLYADPTHDPRMRS